MVHVQATPSALCCKEDGETVVIRRQQEPISFCERRRDDKNKGSNGNEGRTKVGSASLSNFAVHHAGLELADDAVKVTWRVDRGN